MSRIFLPLLILSLVACCIEVDISVPSFPDMERYFIVDEGTIQLTIAYNFLGFCLGAILYGPLSDSYGRRPIMVFGNALLLIGAVGCVSTPTITLLLLSRFVQGIGASTSAVVVFAMIADVYPVQKKAARLIGIMNSALTTLIAIAPVVGGFINEAIGWRGNYAIVASVCLISWILLFFFLPETKKNLTPFKPIQIKADYECLLRSFPFMSASLVPSLLYSAYLSFITQASFLYTETFGLSLLVYVFHQASIVAVFSITSLLSGRFVTKIGARGCMTWGVGLCGFSAFMLVIMSRMAPHSPYSMTLLMCLFGVGFAICYPIIFAASLEIFPKIKGTASSAIMGMRAFLCFGSVGLTSYLYNGHPIRISLLILTLMTLVIIFTWGLLRFGQIASDKADTL